MIILRQLLRKLVGRIANIASKQNRDWDDCQLTLTARSIMASESWQALPKAGQSTAWLSSKEFRVYSQFGDDGIIQFLVHCLGLGSNSSFVEFGVGDFFESNSHFLLVNSNWHGFVMDGSESNIQEIKRSDLFWKYNLQAMPAFVTAENVNDLISQSGFETIQYLHVDLDGNDYWVLKNIDIEKLNPDILILEYNSIFGADRAISIPYDPKFYRFDAHFSGQYFGASLSALAGLAEDKGYYFIGCNSAGNNAYFLANRHKDVIAPTAVRGGFVDAKFRDSRDINGQLTYPQRESARASIRGMPVINVKTNIEETV